MTERIELTKYHIPGEPTPVGRDFCEMTDAYREAYGANVPIPWGVQVRMWDLAFERHRPENAEAYHQVV